MAIERARFIEILEDAFSAYYDIVPENENQELPLAFSAQFHSRAEKYWITKSVPIWSNETNEYAYIFSASAFDIEMVDKCVAFALEDALPQIKPHKEHQYSNVKTLFISDSADKAVRKHIQKLSYTKSYNHSFFGFTNLLTAVVDLSTNKAYSNRAGHDLTKFVGKLFAVRE